MSDKLLPCPFCGNQDIRLQESSATDLVHYFCCNPTCMINAGNAYSEDRARKNWNRRAKASPDDALTAENKELEESISALQNKLGDVCMAHTPKLAQTQQKLDVAVEALKFYSGENIKNSIHVVYINGEYLPDNGDIARAALNTIGKRL